MHGIEYSEPCGNDLRPPGRLNDVVLCVLSDGLLLITGHPARSELLEEVTLMRNTGIHKCDVATAMVELAGVVTI